MELVGVLWVQGGMLIEDGGSLYRFCTKENSAEMVVFYLPMNDICKPTTLACTLSNTGLSDFTSWSPITDIRASSLTFFSGSGSVMANCIEKQGSDWGIFPLL